MKTLKVQEQQPQNIRDGYLTTPHCYAIGISFEILANKLNKKKPLLVADSSLQVFFIRSFLTLLLEGIEPPKPPLNIRKYGLGMIRENAINDMPCYSL